MRKKATMSPRFLRASIPTLLLILLQSLIELTASLETTEVRNVQAEVRNYQELRNIYMRRPNIDHHLFSPKCSLYLAESSISGAGMGVYTTKKIAMDSLVNPWGESSYSVITDINEQLQERKHAFREYVWDIGSPEDKESEGVTLSISTLGSLPNCHPLLSSLYTEPTFKVYDDSILDRMKDAGAGAFSYHTGRSYRTNRNIAPGNEIFISYGEDWFEADPHRIKLFKNMPKGDNYFSAASFISLFKDENLDDSSLSIIRDIVQMFDKKSASVIPRTVDELEMILSRDDNDDIDDTVSTAEKLALATLSHRSIEWIESNGRCLDNLVTAISALPQAGLGAFAQRPIGVGELVITAPSVQIMDANFLEINRENEKLSHQMLLNYCLGHHESSILICPVTMANMINHCSKRMNFGDVCGDGIGPNAKIQWDNGWDKKSYKWRHASLEELGKAVERGKRGLSFEITATRDIQIGEEVLIDYGIVWEQAWEAHLNSWQPPETNDKYFHYTSVTKLTRDQDIRTTAELSRNPYAKNVEFTTCLYGRPFGEVKSSLPSKWKELSDDEIIKHYSKSGEMHDKTSDTCTWVGDEFWTYEPCKIYFHDDNSRLTVGIFPGNKSPPHIFTGYPSHSVKFSSKPYTSDQFLPNSFRHSIGFPDEIFPGQWKNLKKM